MLKCCDVLIFVKTPHIFHSWYRSPGTYSTGERIAYHSSYRTK